MATGQSLNLSSPFTLYYATYSICATMVRLTFAFRGPPKSSNPDMTFQIYAIDISPEKAEQLSEFYLCKVNPNGQVPTLANDELLEKPMPQSLDISYYLCDWYPRLLPKEHEVVIRQLLKELHEINFGVLTFGVGSKHPGKLLARVKELLGQEGIPEQYQKALERKANL